MSDELYEPRRCPLLNRDIDLGLCLEVNYERLGYFKPDSLAYARRVTGLSVERVSEVCEAWPHQPLRVGISRA